MIKTYAQAAAQTHLEVLDEMKKVPRGKGKGPSPPAAKPEVSGGATDLPQRFPYVEDLSDYEEEEERKEGRWQRQSSFTGYPPTGG